MYLAFLLAVVLTHLIAIQSGVSAHDGGVPALHSAFRHFQPLSKRALRPRQFEWVPDLANCPAQCSVLETKFANCKLSQCACTDAVAQGFRDCMVCTIELDKYPLMAPDAQESMNEFEANCDSDGFHVQHITITAPGAQAPIGTSTRLAATGWGEATVWGEATGTVTVYPTSSAFIISGGGSFGFSASFSAGFVSFGSTPPTLATLSSSFLPTSGQGSPADDAATMSSDAGSSAAVSTTAPAQDLDPQSTTPTKNNAEARFAMLPLFAMGSVVFWVQYLSDFV